MDKIYTNTDSEEDSELPLDDGQELNFEDAPREFEEHTFEDDFDAELGETVDIPEEDWVNLDDDLEMIEIDEAYNTWLN